MPIKKNIPYTKIIIFSTCHICAINAALAQENYDTSQSDFISACNKLSSQDKSSTYELFSAACEKLQAQNTQYPVNVNNQNIDTNIEDTKTEPPKKEYDKASLKEAARRVEGYTSELPELPDAGISGHISLKAGMANYSLVRTTGTPYKQSVPVGGVEIGISTENLNLGNFSLNLMYQESKEGSDDYWIGRDADGKEKNNTNLWDRRDYGFTLGWTFDLSPHQFTLFSGQKWSETDSYEETITWIGNNAFHERTATVFKTNGYFIGGQYSYTFENKTQLGIHGAYGILDSDLSVTVGFPNALTPLLEGISLEDSVALRYGAYIFGPLFRFGEWGELNYRISLDQSSYEMDWIGIGTENFTLKEKVLFIMGALEYRWY